MVGTFGKGSAGKCGCLKEESDRARRLEWTARLIGGLIRLRFGIFYFCKAALAGGEKKKGQKGKPRKNRAASRRAAPTGDARGVPSIPLVSGGKMAAALIPRSARVPHRRQCVRVPEAECAARA